MSPAEEKLAQLRAPRVMPPAPSFSAAPPASARWPNRANWAAA